MSQESGAVVKEQGGDNDLVDRIKSCEYFSPIHNKLDAILDASTFIGRAPQQVITSIIIQEKLGDLFNHMTKFLTTLVT